MLWRHQQFFSFSFYSFSFSQPTVEWWDCFYSSRVSNTVGFHLPILVFPFVYQFNRSSIAFSLTYFELGPKKLELSYFLLFPPSCATAGPWHMRFFRLGKIRMSPNPHDWNLSKKKIYIYYYFFISIFLFFFTVPYWKACKVCIPLRERT